MKRTSPSIMLWPIILVRNAHEHNECKFRKQSKRIMYANCVFTSTRLMFSNYLYILVFESVRASIETLAINMWKGIGTLPKNIKFSTNNMSSLGSKFICFLNTEPVTGIKAPKALQLFAILNRDNCSTELWFKNNFGLQNQRAATVRLRSTYIK